MLIVISTTVIKKNMMNKRKHIKLNIKYWLFKDAQNSSVVYTRWGKKACHSSAQTVLSGTVVISQITHKKKNAFCTHFSQLYLYSL